GVNVDGEAYGNSATEALEEILGEALARGRLELATQALSTLEEAVHGEKTRSQEQVQRLALLQQRLGGRTHVALLGGLLRQHGGGGPPLGPVAPYPAVGPPETLPEFTPRLAAGAGPPRRGPRGGAP